SVCGDNPDAALPPDPRVFAGESEQGRLCSADHWCWENPLPQGNTLNAIWASSEDDIWAGGVHGTMLHWDGQAWSNQQSMDPALAISGFWGSAPDDIWAVGTRSGRDFSFASVILHWDGVSWSPVSHPASNRFNSIHGSGRDNVWAVGAGPPVVWNGG